MDLPSTLAARRICYVGGRPFWVRPISIGGIAEIVAWLDDVLPGAREMPPRLGDPASQAQLDTPPGQALLAWIALRDEGVGYEEAAGLWRETDDDGRNRLLSVLFARRRTMGRGGAGDDIGELWCDKEMASAMVEVGASTFRSLTLDQVEFLMSGGECDRHADPGRKALDEAQRIWERQQAERKAAEAPAATSADEDAEIHRRWLEAVEAAKEGAPT